MSTSRGLEVEVMSSVQPVKEYPTAGTAVNLTTLPELYSVLPEEMSSCTIVPSPFVDSNRLYFTLTKLAVKTWSDITVTVSGFCVDPLDQFTN